MDIELMKAAIYPEFYGEHGYIARGIKISQKQRNVHSKRAERAISLVEKTYPITAIGAKVENNYNGN